MNATTSIRPVSPFAIATLAPIPLLVLGGLFGGIFIFAALIYMTVLTMVLDGMFRTAGGDAAAGMEWPSADKLSQGLAIAHFPLLIIGILAVQGTTVGGWSGLAALLAFGMFFGQVSNSNAHELIHRTDKLSFNLGKWVLISLLYGHHVTAHRMIHHRFVGTPQDPNSAPLGEGFWSFAPRAWGDAFVAGYEIENYMAKEAGKELPLWKHPYAEYVGGAVGFLLLVLIFFGFSGLLAYLLLAVYAQLQLLLSDYVQHYGLRRREIEGEDDVEPVAPWHSWNSSHWFSGGLMLNAPRHSDHHMHPARPYPELALPGHMEGPRLPYSLPVMAAIALVPPVWRNVMDRRAFAWQERIDAGSIPNTRLPEPVRVSEAAPAKARRGSTEGDGGGEGDEVASRVSLAMAGEGALEATEERVIDPDAPRVGLRRPGDLAVERGKSSRRRPSREEGAEEGTVAEAPSAEAPAAEDLSDEAATAEALAGEAELADVIAEEDIAEETSARDVAGDAAPAMARTAADTQKADRDIDVAVAELAGAYAASSTAALEPAMADEAEMADEPPRKAWDLAPDPEPEADEPAPPPVEDDEDEGPVAPSSSLWNDPEAPVLEPEPLPEEPDFDDEDEPVDEEERLTAALRAAGVEPSENDEDDEDDDDEAPPVPIEDAVAGVMADLRKAERRKRAGKFPALEPADVVEAPPAEEVSRPSVGSVVRSAGLAARSLAAVLRGAPARPRALPEEPVDDEEE